MSYRIRVLDWNLNANSILFEKRSLIYSIHMNSYFITYE